MYMGSTIAQWLERRARDRKVSVLVLTGTAGELFFSRVNFLF